MKIEFIKKLVELAEGFEWDKTNNVIIYTCCNLKMHMESVPFQETYYPLLLHRAVSGWNRQHKTIMYFIDINKEYIEVGNDIFPEPPLFWYNQQQSTANLTVEEVAIEKALVYLLEGK